MAIAKVRRVYFGPKDPTTGEVLDEPTYTHQEFPKMLYHPDWPGYPLNGKVFETAAEAERAILAGWVDTPARLGAITAPDKAQMEAKLLDEIEAKAKAQPKGKAA